ncbi:MAG TPA: type I glyceraldehyde-3-phosphate dehydrogenase [Patescibacteria group bacterium]|nr:type I glyceraldehyde-3-phosphate dehydrogenase [Patescibacteria group bacterium]
MMTKIAINGFGRIGRAAFKIALEQKNIKVVAINDLTDNKTLAHLLKYDTVYGEYNKNITYTDKELVVDKQKILSFAEKDPNQLPWKKLGVDVVLECTGIFRDPVSAGLHLKAGAKRVIISAPPKSDDEVKNIVLGVNFKDYNPKTDKIISNASCTTNCMAPVAKVLHDKFGIVKAMANTIHSYTADQNLVDGPHKDLRRARTAGQNIIPTSTGSAIAVAKVIPALQGKMTSVAYRVPTACVSLIEFVAELGKPATAEQINNAFISAAKKELLDILMVTSDELVSSDFIGNPYSAIVDMKLTESLGGNLVKVVAWYDNEWGYSNRLVELAGLV